MMRQAVWIVGEPGVGKTTMLRAWMGDRKRVFIKTPKWTKVGDDVVCAGHYSGHTFDGADRVPYNGVAKALEMWSHVLRPKAHITMFDGDRFSNDSVKQYMIREGCIVRAVLIAGEEEAAQRRKQRGSNQNEIWVKGRRTKSFRFWSTFPTGDTLRLGAVLTPKQMASSLESWLQRG